MENRKRIEKLTGQKPAASICQFARKARTNTIGHRQHLLLKRRW
jgi:hypothetical protein